MNSGRNKSDRTDEKNEGRSVPGVSPDVNGQCATGEGELFADDDRIQFLVDGLYSPTHQLTTSPTHQLTNSPTYQLTNSPTYQLTNLPTHQFSQWDVPMLLRRVLIALVRQVPERGDQLRPRFAGVDHFVEETAAGRDVRIRELLPELGHLLRT